ncbi:hypothetical protein KSF78_0001798 [Schistosoma japonicum]|nr:hypothetical protein KSF78_0001798 [Schistosoma japonicum]
MPNYDETMPLHTVQCVLIRKFTIPNNFIRSKSTSLRNIQCLHNPDNEVDVLYPLQTQTKQRQISSQT